MRLIVRIVSFALCAVALGACHSPAFLRKHAKAEQCVEHPAYLAAQNAASLHTPEGLAAPNTKNSLKIPDVQGTAAARTKPQGCLDQPPNFFGEQAKPPSATTPRPSPPSQ